MGKGSIARPFSVTQQEYSERWDAIFGRDIKAEETPAGEEKIVEVSCTSGPPDGQAPPPGQKQSD